jgi:hypothetical protein
MISGAHRTSYICQRAAPIPHSQARVQQSDVSITRVAKLSVQQLRPTTPAYARGAVCPHSLSFHIGSRGKRGFGMPRCDCHSSNQRELCYSRSWWLESQQ